MTQPNRLGWVAGFGVALVDALAKGTSEVEMHLIA